MTGRPCTTCDPQPGSLPPYSPELAQKPHRIHPNQAKHPWPPPHRLLPALGQGGPPHNPQIALSRHQIPITCAHTSKHTLAHHPTSSAIPCEGWPLVHSTTPHPTPSGHWSPINYAYTHQRTCAHHHTAYSPKSSSPRHGQRISMCRPAKPFTRPLCILLVPDAHLLPRR
jgi:hypothetical protein